MANPAANMTTATTTTTTGEHVVKGNGKTGGVSLGKLADGARDELARSLVLNYLSQANYVATARILSEEAGSLSSSRSTSIAESETRKRYPVQMDETPNDSESNGEKIDDVMMASVGDLKESGEVDQEMEITEDAVGGQGEGLLSNEALEEMQQRKNICDHIIVGEITEAISALRLQFPSVLDTTRPRTKANTNGNSTNGNSENQTHPTTEMERASPESPPRSLPSSPELPPLRSLPGHVTSDKGSVRNSANGSTNGSTSSIPLFPYHDVYDRPDFLSINLEIQQFVESLRHMVIPSSPSSMASSIHSDSPFIGTGSSANGTGTGGGGGGGGKSTGSLLGQMPGRDTSILHALNRAQSLHATAKSLSPQESRAYLKEIENVCALLAYTDMEGSPLRGYLDQGRRIALAEQVNGSILVHTGQSPHALLEMSVKQTSFLWKLMVDHGLSPMPDWSASKEGPEWERLASYFRFRRSFELSDYLAER